MRSSLHAKSLLVSTPFGNDPKPIIRNQKKSILVDVRPQNERPVTDTAIDPDWIFSCSNEVKQAVAEQMQEQQPWWHPEQHVADVLTRLHRKFSARRIRSKQTWKLQSERASSSPSWTTANFGQTPWWLTSPMKEQVTSSRATKAIWDLESWSAQARKHATKKVRKFEDGKKIFYSNDNRRLYCLKQQPVWVAVKVYDWIPEFDRLQTRYPQRTRFRSDYIRLRGAPSHRPWSFEGSAWFERRDNITLENKLTVCTSVQVSYFSILISVSHHSSFSISDMEHYEVRTKNQQCRAAPAKYWKCLRTSRLYASIDAEDKTIGSPP